MNETWGPAKAAALAAEFDARLRSLPEQRTPHRRAIRRLYSRRLRSAPPQFVISLVMALVHTSVYRGTAYELLLHHKSAFDSLTEAEIETLGQGIDSWWSVDGYARLVSGPAWLRGLIDDKAIRRWALSDDLWWRRAALVSTVALNIRSQGGRGDVDRTLDVCRLLVEDYEDMVVKALSWALRALVVHDPEAVRAFLDTHREVLAARVEREVRNKLNTGLKNPRSKPEAQDAGSRP